MSPRPKDYFYFNRSEKKSIIALVTLLAVMLIFLNLDPFSSEQKTENFEKLRLVQLYLDSLEQKSIVETASKPKQIKGGTPPKIKLFEFNPNTLSLSGWQKLGLTEKQANTILNYTAKGGSFRIKSDLLKMYSISEVKFSDLEPYILLPDTLKKRAFKNEKEKPKRWEPTIVHINSADSVTFTQLRGVGPVIASRVLKYRSNLGGFYSTNQLTEIYGITDSLLQSFLNQIILDSIDIKNLDINKMGAKELLSNPYIDWNVANSIVNYRAQHGAYKSIEDLKKSVLIDDSLYKKLKPYLLIVK